MRTKVNAIAAMMEAKRSYSEVMEAVRRQIDGMQQPIKEKREYVMFLMSGIRDNTLFNGSVWDSPTSDISYTRAILTGLQEILVELSPKQRQITMRHEAFDCIRSLSRAMAGDLNTLKHWNGFDEPAKVALLYYMCDKIYQLHPKGIADFIMANKDHILYNMFVALDEDANKIISMAGDIEIYRIMDGENPIGRNYFYNICAISNNIREMKAYFSTVLGEASDSQNSPQRPSDSENENQSCYNASTQQKPTEAVNSMSSDSNDTPQQHSNAEDKGKASTVEQPTSVKKETSSKIERDKFKDLICYQPFKKGDKENVYNAIIKRIRGLRGKEAAIVLMSAYQQKLINKIPVESEIKAIPGIEGTVNGIAKRLKEMNEGIDPNTQERIERIVFDLLR